VNGIRLEGRDHDILERTVSVFTSDTRENQEKSELMMTDINLIKTKINLNYMYIYMYIYIYIYI
jgi:hypothetical protein